MPYTAEISRANPSCFIFLIDQSGSMQDVIDPTNPQALEQPQTIDGKTYTHSGAGRTKAQGVADAINKLLSNLVIKCAKEEGIRDYYYVGVIGYGATVGPCFGGALTGKELVPISEIGNNPMRVENKTRKTDDGAGGLVDQQIKFPIWFDPKGSGGTPMEKALLQAERILQDWLNQHPACFPPIVINISDGEADSQPDAASAADRIRNLTSNDGQVLLFNIHISSLNSTTVEFPDAEHTLPDQFAKHLFNMSSALPTYMRTIAQQEGHHVSEGTRGFAFNADMTTLIKFLDIGTRPSNLR
jgi:hypothetical protein